jgi:hypothetical protein
MLQQIDDHAQTCFNIKQDWFRPVSRLLQGLDLLRGLHTELIFMELFIFIIFAMKFTGKKSQKIKIICKNQQC